MFGSFQKQESWFWANCAYPHSKTLKSTVTHLLQCRPAKESLGSGSERAEPNTRICDSLKGVSSGNRWKRGILAAARFVSSVWSRLSSVGNPAGVWQVCRLVADGKTHVETKKRATTDPAPLRRSRRRMTMAHDGRRRCAESNGFKGKVAVITGAASGIGRGLQ